MSNGQAEGGGGAVLQQLQPGIGRQSLRSDPGSDDHGDQQPRTEGLGR
jgi:hypothetical protein